MGVIVKTMKSVNGFLGCHLPTFLFILLLHCSVKVCSDPVTDSLVSRKDTFKVAMFFPLFTGQLATLESVPVAECQLKPESLPGIHAYESALLFRDSLRHRKKVVRFKVIDTGTDEAGVKAKLNSFPGEDYDVILSLLPVSYQSVLTSASLRWERPVYQFQSTNTSALSESKWLRFVVPSNNTQIRMTATLLATSFSDAGIHTVSRDRGSEREVARLFKNVIDSISGDSMRCNEFHSQGQGWKPFASQLERGKKNIVFVPTVDESFLSSFLSAIRSLRQEYQIVLLGMPAWEGFESIDPVLIQDLNTMVFNGYFVDYHQPAVTKFRKLFIQEYHTDPLPQAYMAWDALALAYLEWQEGDTLNVHPDFKRLNIQGELESVCEGCGKENRQVPLMQYLDFELRPFGTEEETE